MRKTLSLPVKARFDAAAFAKTMPKPHPSLIQPAVIETKSRLFDPEILPVPKRRKLKRGHVVEAGTFGGDLRPRRGEMNRPDKSEPKTNLTFNWER